MKYWKKIGASLLGLLVVSAVSAGTNNIAPLATVTASSYYSEAYRPSNVTDGIIGINDKGEWACQGQTADWGYIRFPWIQLTWSTPHLIDRILLFDRSSLKNHTAGGKLTFSDGSVLYVNEIPNNGSAKVVSFDTRKVWWFRFEATDGTGSDLGFSEIEVYEAPENNKDLVSRVDPFIETTRGRYFYFATGATPFGMTSAAPDTRNKDQYGGGYNYNEPQILGFSQIHDWMIGGLEIMPADSMANPSLGESGWKSSFTHDAEIAQPGYHRVFLEDYKTWVELTATDHVSFYRFRYTRDMAARVLVNLGGHIGTCTMANAVIRKNTDKEIEGSFSTIKRYWGGPKDVKVFFVIQFDRSCQSLNAWKGQQHMDNISEIEGDSVGVAAAYNVKAGDLLDMKIAISYTSIENARNNLKAECSGWDFNQVRTATQTEWNRWLGRIEVKGGTTAQQIKFYTDLWHVLLGRHKTNDVSGDYPDRMEGRREGNFTDAIFKIKRVPLNANGHPRFNMYNSDAFWLTQWNLNILFGLGWPAVQDDMAASMIQYADNGYMLPRGPCGGGDSYIMTSCPVSSLIISAFLKNILTRTDTLHAFEVIKRNHLPGGTLGDKEDIDFYTAHGWWPSNAGITVEATFQDWEIAQMADRLGRQQDHDFFLKRSQGWKTCFDPGQGLLFPKDRDGKFVSSDPLSGKGWIEANAWQATWGVSQDIAGLARLMGGKDSLCNKLNFAFEKAASSDFIDEYTNGYISYANQPGLSNAHVFNYAGRPWLTQYWVRKVKEQAYGGIIPDLGYGGHDEDQGQMGSLSALMAIGLFSLQGTASRIPVYDITSPVFDEVTIHLDPVYYKGKEFVIRTHGNSNENCYIQRALLNGKPLNKFWFTHQEFSSGGALELWLGARPNKAWGITQLPAGAVKN